MTREMSKMEILLKVWIRFGLLFVFGITRLEPSGHMCSESCASSVFMTFAIREKWARRRFRRF